MKKPELRCSSTRWVSHAWCSHPDVFLAAEVFQHPEKGALAQWALASEALAVKLKIAAAVLLRLLESPEHHAAAVQATLRSALHHCALVSHEEVLPAVRFFTMKSGAAPKEWREALCRGRKTPNTGVVPPKTVATPTPVAGHDGMVAPMDVDLWCLNEALTSDRQRAVLRSLQAASSLGVSEAATLVQDLAWHFGTCERLMRRLRRSICTPAVKARGKVGLVERWRLAPFRCVSEVPVEEVPRPQTERGAARSLRPLELQIGPVRSYDGLDASMARLVQVEPEAKEPRRPRRPSSQAAGRRTMARRAG